MRQQNQRGIRAWSIFGKTNLPKRDHLIDFDRDATGWRLRTRCGCAVPGYLRPDRVSFHSVTGVECEVCLEMVGPLWFPLWRYLEEEWDTPHELVSRFVLDLRSGLGDLSELCRGFSDWFEERGDARHAALLRAYGGAWCPQVMDVLIEHFDPIPDWAVGLDGGHRWVWRDAEKGVRLLASGRLESIGR